MARVISIGDSCIDVYDGWPSKSAVGGNALNVAINLANLGFESEYIGVVGDDAEGVRVRKALAAARVRGDHVHVVPGRTWVVQIALRAGGVAIVEREDVGGTGPYTPEPAELDYAVGFDHVHLANLADPHQVTQVLRSRGISTSYDHGVLQDGGRPVAAGVAFMSCWDPVDLDHATEIARGAIEHGAELAVVTLGAKGSLAFDGQRVMVMPAHPIHSVDTLGAGDSYIGAFLASRIRGSSVETAMQSATDAASATCLHWAAWPQVPESVVVQGRRP